ncbi:MAG TPA: hypothetical protein VF529_12235 [Solirubrobacteraceae bacterium]|jgi:hypothetical protein
MSVLLARRREGPRAPRRLRRPVVLLAALLTVSGAVALTTASHAVVWESLDLVETPGAPYVQQVGAAQETAQDKSEHPVTGCVWFPQVINECRVRDASETAMSQRATADRALDGPSNAVPPVLETPPHGECVVVEGRAATCTRGGSGGGNSGRTYYKGNPRPECELQRPDVYSTNDHIPKVTYNSLRMCRAMQGGIFSVTRDNRRDCWDTCDGWSGPDDSLMWRSFSARFRKNYCYNDGARSSYVRCAYDWVR